MCATTLFSCVWCLQHVEKLREEKRWWKKVLQQRCAIFSNGYCSQTSRTWRYAGSRGALLRYYEEVVLLRTGTQNGALIWHIQFSDDSTKWPNFCFLSFSVLSWFFPDLKNFYFAPEDISESQSFSDIQIFRCIFFHINLRIPQKSWIIKLYVYINASTGQVGACPSLNGINMNTFNKSPKPGPVTNK